MKMERSRRKKFTKYTYIRIYKYMKIYEYVQSRADIAHNISCVERREVFMLDHMRCIVLLMASVRTKSQSSILRSLFCFFPPPVSIQYINASTNITNLVFTLSRRFWIFMFLYIFLFVVCVGAGVWELLPKWKGENKTFCTDNGTHIHNLSPVTR